MTDIAIEDLESEELVLTPTSIKAENTLATYVVPLDATNLSSNANPEEVIKQDVAIVNGVLRAVAAGWNHVRSLRDIEQMAKLTMSMVEQRRKVLNQNYGPVSDSKKPSINDYIT